HTKQPELLRELFQALGNDPFVIAECLARATLAQRLLTNWHADDPKTHSGLIQRTEAHLRTPKISTATYMLPRMSDAPNGCIDDMWTATSTINAPSRRNVHTAVWTGSEMIVWGGIGNSVGLDTGGKYNPSTDTWTATSTTNAPAGRYSHTAVWTGSE